MALELVTIPCLQDNYAYLLHDPTTRQTAVVDVPEVAPILKELVRREWLLTSIFLTHHHDDHIQGVDELRTTTGARFDVGAALARMIQLRPAVALFFDQVLVMAEDEALRHNRLGLLRAVAELFRSVADFRNLSAE